MGLRKKPPLGALCRKGPTPPVRWSWRTPPPLVKPVENPAAAALAERLRLRVWICSGIKVVVVMWVLRKSLICSSAWRAAGRASMSRGVKSAEEVENCLWGLSSSVHKLLTRRCRCSKSISLSSYRGGEGDGKNGARGDDDDCRRWKTAGRRDRIGGEGEKWKRGGERKWSVNRGHQKEESSPR